MIEDHYVILEELVSACPSHGVPKSDHGNSNGLRCYRFLSSKDWTGSIRGIGADGCNFNPGNKRGSLSLSVKYPGQAVATACLHAQWLRNAILSHCLNQNGGTSGSFTLKGSIESILSQDFTELDIISCKAFSNPNSHCLQMGRSIK